MKFLTMDSLSLPCLRFLQKGVNHIWKLYRDDPSAVYAETLRTAFDLLFGHPSGYDQLDARKALTLARKKALLMMLSHPEILLHNNPAALGVRQHASANEM